MNGISGLELAKSLPKGTCLIFTTAYAQFALDGFELNAIDYLHKPFSFSRFEKAVQKAKDLLQMRNLAQKPTLPDVEITVKVEYQNVRIAVPDIQYIEAMDNYIKIYTMDARPVVSPNHACDRFMAMVGGWTDVGAYLRWPYRSIPLDRIESTREQVKNIIPEFFIPPHKPAVYP